MVFRDQSADGTVRLTGVVPYVPVEDETDVAFDVNVPPSAETKVFRRNGTGTLKFVLVPAIDWSSAWSFITVPADYCPVVPMPFAGFNGTTGGVALMQLFPSGVLHIYTSIPLAGQQVIGSVSYPLPSS